MGRKAKRASAHSRNAKFETFFYVETNGNDGMEGRFKLLKLRAGDGDRTRDVQGRKTMVFHRVSRPERLTCQLGKMAFN